MTLKPVTDPCVHGVVRVQKMEYEGTAGAEFEEDFDKPERDCFIMCKVGVKCEYNG